MKKSFVALAFASLLALSSSAIAAAPAGILYASGSVNVNGMSVSRSKAVFEGDVVRTDATSAGTLSYNGSSVLVNGSSSVAIAKNMILIRSGSAAVQTANGLSAQIGNVNVVPKAQTARFRVMHNGNSVTVVALEQDLSINNGTRSMALQAGRTVTVPLVDSALQSAKDDRSKASGGITEPQDSVTTATQGGGNSGGSGSGATDSEFSPGLIAIITATISSAITTGLMFGQSPATPIAP